jgi:two-component system, chemotaxis family, CheB/CheR fusion protein
MERELEQARQEVRVSRDEMQIFQEEARCANEEMQSMNEELQSMNEELQMLNHELNVKVNDMSRLNNDMKNLLDSTELTTLFLDKALNVRLFTTGSNKIFKLMRGDIGRPITDIASDLHYLELADDVQEVMRTLVPHEQQVTTRDGQWFLMRIMPYRTLENMIDGVVITFVDITVSKALEVELRKTQADLYKQIDERDLKLEQRGSLEKDSAITSASEETKISLQK